jgi:predicted GNAT family acetyltransferase
MGMNTLPQSKLPSALPTADELLVVADKTNFGDGYYVLMTQADEDGVSSVAAKLHYADNPTPRVKGRKERFITWTEVPKENRMKGYGREIVLRGFHKMKEDGFMVLPICAFAYGMLKMDKEGSKYIADTAAQLLMEQMAALTRSEADELLKREDVPTKSLH